MFGGPVDPPTKPKPRPKPGPEFRDILNPSVHPGHYAHYGREPNTNYKTRLMLYKQRTTALEREAMAAETARVANELYRMKFQWNTDKKWARLNLRNQVNQKMQEYDEELDRKRERLRELLAKEEREECRETVDNLQKGEELKYEAMKARVRQIDAEREEERRRIVEEKRIQQYADRCENLRPALEKKHLLESKTIQLQQMRENESRRESEREWDRMWEDAMNREIQARMEREEQDAIDRYIRRHEMRETLENQIKGKELAKLEQIRNQAEDALEMEKLAEQMRREKIAEVAETKKRKAKAAEELIAQIKFQERVLADRALEQKRIDDAFIHLSKLEYEKELVKVKDSTEIAKAEMRQYRQHLHELEQERKQEDKKLEELLEEHRIAIEKKQDEARCKVLEAKEKLLQDVLAGRAEQLEHKKQEAQQRLRMKQAENELCQLTYDANKRLCEEDARLRAEAAAEYRDDLCRQIEYNNKLRLREQAEIERQLEVGRREEKKYREMVESILNNEHQLGDKHPFRKVLEQYDCRCPKLNQKY